MKRLAILGAAALLATSAPAAAQPDPIVTAAEGYQLRLMGAGLAAGRVGLHSYPVFEFGISRAEALRRVGALRGRVDATGTRRDCGAAPLDFARFGTLTLWFRGDNWVGWSLTGPPGRRPIRSEWDMGIGTPRREIDSMDGPDPFFRRTARGVEFFADHMSGRLIGQGAQARIGAMWSGETCEAR